MVGIKAGLNGEGSCPVLFELRPYRDYGLRGRRGRACSWRYGRCETRTGDRSGGDRQGGVFQARSIGGHRDARGARELRRDHCRRPDAVRPHALQWGASGSRRAALWMGGALHGKVGAAFTSSATQHGGNETTLFSIIANLMHFGMVIVGLPYSHAGQMSLDEIVRHNRPCIVPRSPHDGERSRPRRKPAGGCGSAVHESYWTSRRRLPLLSRKLRANLGDEIALETGAVEFDLARVTLPLPAGDRGRSIGRTGAPCQTAGVV
jgi:hypothetical protein